MLHKTLFGIANSSLSFDVTREELNSKMYHLQVQRGINCISAKFEHRRTLVIKFSRSNAAAEKLMK